jgi:hypothetical protein
MKGLQSGDLEDMFRKPDDDDDEESALQNINVNFDLKTGKIKLTSAATNTEGKSLYGYDLDTKTGAIEVTTRDAYSTTERVVEKSVDPKTLIFDATIDVPKELLQNNGPFATSPVETKEQKAYADMTPEEQREWDEIEMQRDIAFKIMYFFIAFVFATFGLLYIYFKMHQKAK